MKHEKVVLRFHTLHRYLPVILIMLALAACASPPVRQEPPPQWPAHPQPAQVTWSKSIRDYRDTGIRKGFWRRFVDLVVGEGDIRIGQPYGIYADREGRLFIADTLYNVVHVMDSKKMTYTIIGGEQPIFRKPIAITGDDEGNVYITDSAGGAVFRYSTRDARLTLLSRALERPTGIAFNRSNRLLYVTDTSAHQIAVLDREGRERFRFGSLGDAPGRFNHPTDLFIDQQGTVYVTDPLNARIQLFSPDGSFQRTFGRAGDAPADFSKPKGVAVDRNGKIYVCDALFDMVKVFNPTGDLLLEVGERGNADGQFWMPSGIYIDSNDLIYVADTYNRRIQIFRPGRADAIRDEVTR